MLAVSAFIPAAFQVLFSRGYLHPEPRKALRLVLFSCPSARLSPRSSGPWCCLLAQCWLRCMRPCWLLWDEASISWQQGRTAATASCRWELAQKRSRKRSRKAEHGLGSLGVSVRPRRRGAVFSTKRLRVRAAGEVFRVWVLSARPRKSYPGPKMSPRGSLSAFLPDKSPAPRHLSRPRLAGGEVLHRRQLRGGGTLQGFLCQPRNWIFLPRISSSRSLTGCV